MNHPEILIADTDAETEFSASRKPASRASRRGAAPMASRKAVSFSRSSYAADAAMMTLTPANKNTNTAITSTKRSFGCKSRNSAVLSSSTTTLSVALAPPAAVSAFAGWSQMSSWLSELRSVTTSARSKASLSLLRQYYH